jgi:hypothetical protein
MVVKFFTSSLKILKKFLGGAKTKKKKKNKKIYCGSVFILKKNLVWGVYMGNGRFKIPLSPPHRPGTLRYNIPFQANLLIHILFTV